ncbi:hypothetical protein ACFX2I_024994 [Malus domestica]
MEPDGFIFMDNPNHTVTVDEIEPSARSRIVQGLFRKDLAPYHRSETKNEISVMLLAMAGCLHQLYGGGGGGSGRGCG